ncbi:hypothetical protein L6452_36667 [Arctium lappa]|uniref:Uncharacterized protein n=1 Tax=Arctium lappa TaxID=4217 RepID=A0ACB8YBB3_ARCLA|nr:hypothetical protein L6452_36667 [Arctium lappa]
MGYSSTESEGGSRCWPEMKVGLHIGPMEKGDLWCCCAGEKPEIMGQNCKRKRDELSDECSVEGPFGGYPTSRLQDINGSNLTKREECA